MVADLLTRPAVIDGVTVQKCALRDRRARRKVLGLEHVDRASANTDQFAQDFEDFITRSMVTLTTFVARGDYLGLAIHLRAARTNGLTMDEIKELLPQTAIFCGAPDANAAFRIASRRFAEQSWPPEGRVYDLRRGTLCFC